MTALIILAVLVGVVGGAAFLISWLTDTARREGKAAEQAETNEKAAANAEKAGEILAEHRDDADTAERLGKGTF